MRRNSYIKEHTVNVNLTKVEIDINCLVFSSDNTLYTGWTNDIIKRLTSHNSGKGAKYTRGRGPLAVAYTEECPDKGTALRREYAIKALSREEKEKLIKEQGKKNISDILDNCLEYNIDQTIKVIGLMCFMNEEEAIREMHEEAIVPAGYTTIESITEFLELQGCVYSVSYDRE